MPNAITTRKRLGIPGALVALAAVAGLLMLMGGLAQANGQGPITTNVFADPNPASIYTGIDLTATVDDSTTGGSSIASAQYSLDGGVNWTTMSASESPFDNVSEDVEASIGPFSEPDVIQVCVRGKDVNGNTGAEECIFLAVFDPDAGFVTGGGWIDSPPGAFLAGDAQLPPFTQDELDTNWEADRQFPSDGVASVTSFGRDNVARIGIDRDLTENNTFRRTEGIKTLVGDFGTAVQVDLFIDPEWQNKAVRAGFWVVGDDGSGGRDNWFGILEFVNLEPSTSGDSAQGDHEGWRFWDSTNGWTNLSTGFAYGEWVTLRIELDTDAEEYNFFIDGALVGSGPGGLNFIRELFLNSYNFGLDTFPNLGNDSYAAHWHAGGSSLIEGKANFGFVSKYKKGANVPTGNTQFQFKVADLNFHSTEYEWLVVTGSNFAKFKGEGTINGETAPNSSSPFKFQVWAGDGTGPNGEDTFRIKIWYENGDDEVVVYDNNMHQPIGGGSIKVHNK